MTTQVWNQSCASMDACSSWTTSRTGSGSRRRCRATWRRGSLSSLKPPRVDAQDADDNAFDDEVRHPDRLVGGVGRLQAIAGGLAVEALDGGLRLPGLRMLQPGHHNGAVLGLMPGPDSHQVAVHDAFVDHAVATDPEHEGVLAEQATGHFDAILDVALSQDRRTGRDLSDDRQAVDVVGRSS